MNKKILLVTRPLCTPWDEASKNFAYDLAKILQNTPVTILTHGHIDDLPKNVSQQSIYTQSAFSFTQKIRLIYYLWKHAQDFKIIHLLFTPTKFNAKILKMILPSSCKIIQTLATLREDLYSTDELKKMLFGDVIITYSEYSKNRIEKLFGSAYFTDKNVKIYPIYPGIDLTKYIPAKKDSELMKKWKIDCDDKIVTYPGEYVRLGATDVIVSAFLELWKYKHNHHIKYLCACRVKNEQDAKKKKDVMTRFEKAGHSDKVIYTDTYGDMNKIYNLSDIVLFPVENMHGKFDVPLAMIEPYACKKPVIASDLPLFKEFSSSAFNVIIPRDDHHALATAIKELSIDHKRREELGEHAWAFAHKTFNITAIAAQYEKLYRQL